MSQPASNGPRLRQRLARALPFALLLGLSGCDDPCEKLHKKVCDDVAYFKANKKHCDLMNEQARRDALPKEYCESILKSIAKQ
jgi:hypothetical protein